MNKIVLIVGLILVAGMFGSMLGNMPISYMLLVVGALGFLGAIAQRSKE